MKMGQKTRTVRVDDVERKPTAFKQPNPLADGLAAEVLGGRVDPRTAALAVHSEGFHGESPETLAGLLELHDWLARKIDEKLSPCEAEIVRLSLRQFTTQEISSHLGIPKKLVESRRYQAVGKLTRAVNYTRPRIIDSDEYFAPRQLLSAAICPGHERDSLLYERRTKAGPQ